MSEQAGTVVGRRLAGLAFLLVPALLIALSVAIYDKQFTEVATVKVRTSAVGNQMHPGADVKVRGAVVGEVRKITADGNGATLTLAIKPETIKKIPADVTAQMLPTTVFGARFVALVPAQTGGRTLADGDVISEDRSSNAIELQEVLRNVLPMLTAVQPRKLAATLNAMATALDGKGADLGENLVRLDEFLRKFNPNLPELNKNIHELGKFANLYAGVAPDIVDALYDLAATSRTIVEERKNLTRFYSSITSASQDLETFLRENDENLIRLQSHSRPSLEVLAKYSPEFPCVFKQMAETIPLMDKVLGKGTDQPGVHIQLKSVGRTADSRYRPGKDKPVYNAKGGPHCYPVPFQGPVKKGGLGLPNSPQENALVNELVASDLNETPEALPDWSSVLLAPIFRGTNVGVKP